MTDFTWLDYIIFFIYFISIVLGLARGVFRELISLGVIIVALIVMVKFTKPLTYFLYLTPGSHDVIAFISKFAFSGWSHYLFTLTLVIALLILFVGTLSIGEAVNHYVGPNTYLSAGISFIYRVAGGAVGLARGYVFNIIFVLILSVSPLSFDDAWKNSKLVPKLYPLAAQLGSSIQPEGFGTISSNQNGE
jgi:membrane protein required for colicin V production